MRSKGLATVVVVVVVLGLVGCGAGTTVATGEPPSAERLAALLQHPPADYNVRRSISAVGAESDVVATGVLVDPRSARAIYGSPTDPYPTIRTIAFELVDVEVLGGRRPDLLPGDDVVVELRAPGMMMEDDGLDDVQAALVPGQRGLYFLDVYDIDGKTTVRGEDPSLAYLAPHPQGVAFEASTGGTVTPTDPIPGAASMGFDALVAAAREELVSGRPATSMSVGGL